MDDPVRGMSMLDEVSSNTMTFATRRALTAYQEAIYRGCLHISRGAIIAGGYPAYQIGWKKSYSDVDIFIPLYLRPQELKHYVQPILDRLMQHLIYVVPNFIREIDVVNMCYIHQQSKLGLIRVQLKKYEVDIILQVLPATPRRLSDREHRFWTCVYVLSSFDLMFSRVAIVDYNPINSVGIVMGRYELAVSEVEMRLYKIDCAQRLFDRYLLSRRRLRGGRNQQSHLERYQRNILHAKDRLLKYIPDSGAEVVNYVDDTCFLVSLPYGLNPNQKRVLPTCLDFLESRIRHSPALRNLESQFQQGINLQQANSVIDEENLPVFPEYALCNVCRFH